MGDDEFQVVIAGGGVAAMEAVLALREHDPPQPIAITMLAPDRDFRLQALSVAEPFGADGQTIDLDGFCAEHGAEYLADAVAEVWGGPQRVLTARGDEVFYDALLMATGAHRHSVLPGSHSFRGAGDVGWFGTLLERLERGAIADVAFAVPRSIKWTLPIFELAMLTSAWLERGGHDDARLSVVTHERAPLEVLGSTVSEQVGGLLGERGVEIIAGAGVVRFDQGRLVCEGGRDFRFDEVVSLPGLTVPEIPGVPQGRHGFIGCDAEMRVDGLEHVWVAGDSSWFPVKQGGLAAQQAEIAVTGIVRAAGADIEPPPFRPVIRGALITGGRPRFLRVELGDDAGAALAGSPLWWPPIKVAGPRLGPYLARRWALGDAEEGGLDRTEDLEPPRDEREHEAALRLSLDFAEIDAREGDYEEALRWLGVAERLNVTLPAEYVGRRESWRTEVAGRA
ncbi:MAG TPA: FAD/NAD(P)-binding oxidoreductase [Solirubrobacterales bacterium]|nr:FAD/NAD(P)-binding oxidoreductase [Solirubrobacterales bacterium]